MIYNPQKVEKKWQEFWKKETLYQAKDLISFGKGEETTPKMYILVEFPYPSGDGLHVGHCRSYVALDVVARKKRMEGVNVLFPMGWDAFGLPTENYAIKTGIHPKIATEKNTAVFKRQQNSIGLSFDWNREINTTDPEYYKWTQWIFVQLHKKGLAYKAKIPINWCSSCKTGLANEEVVNGCCERCGVEVERKEKEQWMLRITKYADRLIKDLDLIDYPEKVKTLQKDWIGRSEGTQFEMPIYYGKESQELGEKLGVFTTRVDTVFGMTYVVVSTDHPLVSKITTPEHKKEVEKYIKGAKSKMELERVATEKEKTGVFSGSYSLNIFNNQKIPIYISDYILMTYGTGAIMAVPAHDERDYLFAKKYDLPIVEVIKPEKGKSDINKEAFVEDGVLINSGQFNDLTSAQAREKMTQWLIDQKMGQQTVYYKLRDWVFSRQHYWGEPIPMVNCKKCGQVAVPEKDLPVELPEIKKYQPTETGESPLAQAKDWVNTKCPQCGEPANRETDTMPNWAGSNWYFLRYCDPKNNKALADPKLLEYWMPVDWYNGGMEHTTLHLLYSRFIYKFLWDIGAVPKKCGPEPYKKRTCHGMVLGEGWVKMSKSKGNVINPDEVIKKYGADTLRMYELFMGPFNQTIAWNTKGVKGVKRFLDKVWKLSNQLIGADQSKKQQSHSDFNKVIHRTIKKVSEDIEVMKFNTAISTMMEFTNSWQKDILSLKREDFENFLKILAPFAPHLVEELWEKSGHKKSIFLEIWPEYDLELVKEKTIILVIQVNGKVRDKIKVEADIIEEKAKEIALSQEKIKKWVQDKDIKKTIFVPKKLINIVI